MKKTKFLSVAALALAFGLASCGGPAAGQESGAESAPATSAAATSVAKPKITVSAEGDKKTLVMEETVQLSAKEGDKALTGVEWKSSAEAVATVDQTGKVTAVAPGTASISASLEGYNKGSITITVTRPAPIATLHFEDADHFAADGWWGTAAEGWSPEYERTEGNASDSKCIAHMDEGDKETLTFTSSAAISAELVIMMASSDGVTDMSSVMDVKLNNTAIDMTGKALTGTGSSSTFGEFSLGTQSLIAGDNVLELSFKASAPYIDDLNFYSKQQSTIAVKAAPAKERIEVQLEAEATGITAYIGEETQITLTKPTDTTGVTYASSKESVATVDQTGKITGVAIGTANITISKAG
ncbi:MAG: Ig-like domain-containing protein, partial [Bacilli bacterium]|nr:Ig-like domain-containing protein [Bacilli bacterium]